MSILPQDEAAAIFSHYFQQLARQCGLKWTDRNQADIERAADLLSTIEPEPPTDEIPPYRPIYSDRQTVVLSRDELDPAFERWRRERRDDDEQARRMLRRERGTR